LITTLIQLIKLKDYPEEIIRFLHTNKKPIVDYLYSLPQIVEMHNKDTIIS